MSMLSWFKKNSDNNLKRIVGNSTILYKDHLEISNGQFSIILKSLDDTEKYLYGDVLLMEQVNDTLVPIVTPQKINLNLEEHPQVQEFIFNSKKKLVEQLRNYESILESLKKADYEESQFETQFFEEYNKLRSKLFQNSRAFLEKKMNATQEDIEKFIENEQKSLNSGSQISVTKYNLKKINPKIRELFNNNQ